MKKLVVVLAVVMSGFVVGQRIEMSTTYIGFFEAFNEEFDIKNTWRFYDNSDTNSFNMPALMFIEPIYCKRKIHRKNERRNKSRN